MIDIDGNRSTPHTRRWLWLSPFVYVIVISVYFVARYGGHWAETDSAELTQIIRVFAQAGTIVPQSGTVYPNGYVYQAISTYLLGVTGADAALLQMGIYPLVACIVVLPAWLFYREIIGSSYSATIATVLLFAQPEFLFVILRSSHEKFTRTFMFAALYLLARTFARHRSHGQLVAETLLFYLMIFSLITVNNLLGNSFVVAIACALIGGWVIGRCAHSWSVDHGSMVQRGLIAAIASLGFAFVFTFYIYPPAEHDIQVLGTIPSRVAALFLDVQRTGGENTTNAYAAVGTGWVSTYAYFAVSISNWLILVSSAVIWIYQAARWIVWRQQCTTSKILLLWLLYGAFALQVAGSVVVDASGALSGNLQVRLFPSFSLIAVAVVAKALGDWRPQRLRLPVITTLTVAMFCISGLSVMKATNEPFLSNNWILFDPDEVRALTWADTHSQYVTICADYDNRISSAYLTTRGVSTNHNVISWNIDPPFRCTVLDSSILRLRGVRLGRALPVQPDAQRIYDNGTAQLYRPWPRTPFQK